MATMATIECNEKSKGMTMRKMMNSFYSAEAFSKSFNLFHVQIFSVST